MTKQKHKKNALIGLGVGVALYIAAWVWAEYTARKGIGVGANIGAGLLALLGQAIAACSAITWLLISALKRD